MNKINKLSTLTLCVNVVFALFVFYIHEFIIDAIKHNIVINIVISLLMISGMIFASLSAIKIKINYSRWQRGIAPGNGIDSQLSLKIFGKSLTSITSTTGKKRDELVTMWVEVTEWRGRILEYLSGTLIGLGLLGTFIGLMGTMGSISGVLGAATGDNSNAMVEAISTPLGSMSGAFSASLMGLMSSLFVGLLAMLVERLNADYVENIKTWIYSQPETTDSESFYDDADGVSLSEQNIRASLSKMGEFCEQTKQFITQLDNKVESFNQKMAKTASLMVDEVAKVHGVSTAVGTLGKTILDSHQTLATQVTAMSQAVAVASQQFAETREALTNEIILNRQALLEIGQASNAGVERLINEALSNRSEILKLNKISSTLENQLEHYQVSLNKELLSLHHLLSDSGNVAKELGRGMQHLSESTLYNKNNIDKILSIQGITHDINLYALEEVMKTHHAVDRVLASENSEQGSGK